MGLFAVLLSLLSLCHSLPRTSLPSELRIFHCNVGNLDESGPVFGPCPGGEPYKGGLCSLRQEQALAKHIAALSPHVVTLVEIVSAAMCAKNRTWCPSTLGSNASDAPCCYKNVLEQQEQVLRILPPSEGWSVSCDTNDGHACIGVRSDERVAVSIEGCKPGRVCNSTTPNAPPESVCNFLDPPADLRSDVSWVNLTLNGQRIRYVISHPWAEDLSVPKQWPCTGLEYLQAFQQNVSNCVLLSGDWNADCYRFPTEGFPACKVWHQFVGSQYTPVFYKTPHGYPLPSWGVPEPIFTLDYFLYDPHKCAMPSGWQCQVLGVSPNTTRVDDPWDSFDHKAVFCRALQ